LKVFEIIKRVLDSEFLNIEAEDNAGRIDLVNQEILNLDAAYRELTDESANPPNYRSPAARFAYIYKYTTCHADIVCKALGQNNIVSLRRLFEGDDWLKVACIGGGPGSDFIGVLKYLALSNIRKNLRCFLLDSEPAWGDTWSEVDEQAEGLEIRISTHYQELNVCEPDTWDKQTKYYGADLYTLIYFLSEVYRRRNEAENFFRNLVMNVKPGAVFLVVDNNSPDFVNYISSLANEIGLKSLGRQEKTFVLGPDEQKSALGDYLDQLNHNPKCRTKIYFEYFEKPICD